MAAMLCSMLSLALMLPQLPRVTRAPTAQQHVAMSLVLTEENVLAVLADCEAELGTMFGTSAANRGVGITGAVEFVELDGPSVVVRFTGRFWHARADVLARIENYVLERIPEAVSVDIEDVAQLDDADPVEGPSNIDDL